MSEKTEETPEVKPAQEAVKPIAESKPEEKPETKPVEEVKPLAEAEVVKIVGETHLPDAAQKRLAAQPYANEKELRTAIEAEVEYVKTLTGSGKPWGLGGTQPADQPISEADYQKSLDEIDRRHGIATRRIA